MKLILYQATMAITEIDFVPGPFRFQIEQQHLDFAVGVCPEVTVTTLHPPRPIASPFFPFALPSLLLLNLVSPCWV